MEQKLNSIPPDGAAAQKQYEAEFSKSSQTIAKPLVSSSLVKVYEALYNPMTWESSYGTLSIHLSKEGAEKAIAFHKMEQIKEWEKLYPNEDDKPYKFGDFEDWAVREVDVLP